MLKGDREEGQGKGRGKQSSKLAAYWAHCIDVSLAAVAFIVVLFLLLFEICKQFDAN